jgi:hypothetical protein
VGIAAAVEWPDRRDRSRPDASRPAGIRVHNVRALDPADISELDAIPVTSVHRTLLDYAEVTNRQRLRLAIEAADRKEVFDLKALEQLSLRSTGRRGVKSLKAVLAEITKPTSWTRSELERRALALLREGGVPEPQVNVVIAGELVDLYWPGSRVLRITQERIERGPREVLSDVTRTLRAAGASDP